MHVHKGKWECHYCGYSEQVENEQSKPRGVPLLENSLSTDGLAKKKLNPSEQPAKPTEAQNEKLLLILSRFVPCGYVEQVRDQIVELVWRWKR